MLGQTPITLSSKKQGIVTLSSCEAEYVASSYVACQTLWCEMLLKELNVNNCVQINLLVDNQLSFNLENYLMSYGRSKHIKRR